MFRVGLKRAGLAGHSLRAGLRSPIMATALNAASAAVERAAAGAGAGAGAALVNASGAGIGGGVGCGMGVAYGALNTAFGGLQLVRWATKKAAGSSSNKKDSPGKHLGLKVFGGAWVEPGNIIVRQRGTKWHAGMNVALGKDHTISALVPGHVRFTHTERPHRQGTSRYRTWVSVVPHGQDPAILRAYFDANQSRYARIISDKYHRVPRAVWAPRERAAAVIERDALRHAIEEDAARRRLATVAFVHASPANTTAAAGAGAAAAPAAPESVFPVPHLMAPLRAHSTVTRVRSAMAVFGERLRKAAKRAPKPATVRERGTASQPVPTVAPAAPTYVAKA